MIKYIVEEIPQRVLENGTIVPKHDCLLSYDTSKIKDTCVECGRLITKDVEKNYIKYGNMCEYCHMEVYRPDFS